ncbi:hypothetical protein JHK86_009798 [Glycine max]|nr:hypothetical protein JHK86_009798 [Glycine max]
MTSWRLVSDVPRATNNPPTHCLNTPKGNHTPQRTGNTTDDLSLSHMHVQKGRLPINILFFDHIMEADIPLGWKPLNLEQYDRTTNLHEHLDAFLTQIQNLNPEVVLHSTFHALRLDKFTNNLCKKPPGSMDKL